MDFERLMLSKPSAPGRTSYVSNLAITKDSTHDYGFAELAEILGLNYDATKQVIYAGNSSSYGFYLNITSGTTLQVRMYIQDTIITATNTYVTNLSLTQSDARLIYKSGDNGVCFGFIYGSDLKINYIVTTGLNANGDVKNCYFLTTGASSDPLALYSETNSSADINSIKIFETSPSIMDKRSTNLINLCPVFNGYEEFYSNKMYLGIAYPSNKPTTANILNINNKEYVALSRYTTSSIPIIFETGNEITSS